MHKLKIKRVYEQVEESDGFRILIDRIWPRGISKDAACLEEWAKDVAPTPALRIWFAHKEENFESFKKQYDAELSANPAAVCFARHCNELLQEADVTLLYGARSKTCNHAVILRDWILSRV